MRYMKSILTLLVFSPILLSSQNSNLPFIPSCPPNCISDQVLIYIGDQSKSEENFTFLLSDKVEMAVYPNPVNNVLNFSLENTKSGNWQIQIINSVGDIVLNDPFSKVIHVSSLKPGYYVVQVFASNNKIYRAKFIKN